VDDDAPLRRALQRLLRSAGFSVKTFGSAEDFLAADHAPLPGCLVLDIQLGALTGFDLHDRLRARGVSIPTIFITGHDSAARRERARKIGAAGYVCKPFDEACFIAAIERAMAQADRQPRDGAPFSVCGQKPAAQPRPRPHNGADLADGGDGE
jgi:FixJ family two-component response regulator